MTAPSTRERRDLERATDAPAFGEPVRLRPRPPSGRRTNAELHLLTYVVGNVLFWTLWGAISISTEHWYWWPIVPMAGWTAVLGLHLWIARRTVAR